MGADEVIASIVGQVSDRARAAFRRQVPIIKREVEGEQRFVLGVVMEPDAEDSQGDVTSEDEIRQAAHTFMAKYRTRGLMHRANLGERVFIVESYIAPADLTFNGVKVRKGTWLMAWRIEDDQIWEGVKSGQYTGFSIGGTARRVPQ